VPSPPICAHVFQTSDVLLHLSPQIVLNLHVRELGGKVQDGRVLQTADLRPRVDVEPSHDALRNLGADAEEALEGTLRDLDLRCNHGASSYLDERRLGEVEAVKKHLYSQHTSLIPYLHTYHDASHLAQCFAGVGDLQA
jgi:hypothetical protein